MNEIQKRVILTRLNLLFRENHTEIHNLLHFGSVKDIKNTITTK